jgi:hypothetical protein
MSASRSRHEVQRVIPGHRNGGRRVAAQTTGEKSEFEFLIEVGAVWGGFLAPSGR